jgi:hypothetical protein
MSNMNGGLRSVVVVTCALLLAAAPVYAEKPSWAGGGKDNKGNKGPDKEARGDESGTGPDHHGGDHGDHGAGMEYSGGGVNVSVHFTDDQRTRLRTYYGDQVRSGHCPPGLAKKNNGCMPPGQAKKWAVGQPLPRDVIFYDLEPEIVIQLGIPPPNHRFVRVASDILLIAVGTGMVLDAIEDLGNL